MADSLQWILDLLLGPMEGVRQRRRFIENEWLLNYRAYYGWPSQSYAYPLPDNAIHYFIPHLRIALERNVKRANKLLMPNMDWHSTLPNDPVPHENVQAVHAVMHHILRKRIPVKRNISSALRCIQLYNFACLGTSVQIQGADVWPTQATKDPFSFYVFPDTASSREEALLIFNDFIIPYQVYNSYVSKDKSVPSIYKPIDPTKLYTPEWPYHLIERLAYKGLSNPSDFTQAIGSTAQRTITEYDVDERRTAVKASLAEQGNAFVKLSEAYFRIGPKWFLATICHNLDEPEVVRLDEEENTPYFRWCTTRPLPGELYATSPADDNRVLQNLTNNAISNAESNRSAYAEPPLLINSQIVGRMENKTLGNRRLWQVDGDPKGQIADLTVQDTFTKGLQAAQVYLGLLNKGSGGQLAEGQPGRNMPRAGFASNTLLNMALIDPEDEADTVEQELLMPGLADIYHCILEYVPDSQILKIPNRNPQLVKAYAKRDLVGDYSFEWLGALGFQDAQVRADKFMQFFAALANPQVLPVLMQALAQDGKMLDIASILQTIYSYGLSERGLGDIIKPIPPQVQQQSEQQQQMQQQVQLAEVQGKIQHAQLRNVGEQLKNQGKLIDIRGKQVDIQGKLADIRGKHIENTRKLLEPLGKGSTGD